MADKKISQLTASTTPLAGTEILPVVQSGITKKVSVSDLTVGRDVVAKSLAANVATGGASILLNTDDANADARNWGVLSTYYEYGDLCFVQSATKGGSPVGGTVRGQFRFYDGSLKLNTGNLQIGTSGKGIDFSATSDAGGMTSELLNDYEEGTWTPTVAGSWTTTPTIYGTATYTKIGRQVTINFAFLNGAKATTYGGYFDGLPFTIGSTGVGSVVDNNIVDRGGAEVSGSTKIYVSTTSAPDVNFVTITYFV